MTTSSSSRKPASINPSLVKKMLLRKHPKQRISNEAVQLTGELLRLFILEARNRAAIEAECEREVNVDEDTPGGVQIKAHNITKVAAELLMDFS